MTEIVKTVADNNTSAVHEMTEIRLALLDDRGELRCAFADTTTRELVIRLHNQLQGEIRANHTNARGHRNAQLISSESSLSHKHAACPV
jgi:hypothetical protein